MLPSPRLPEEARQRRVFEMVEALQEHPRDPSQVLIGYSRGLIVIWDLRGSRVLCHFLSSQVGGAWDGGSRHGALPDPIATYSPWAEGRGWGCRYRDRRPDPSLRSLPFLPRSNWTVSAGSGTAA